MSITTEHMEKSSNRGTLTGEDEASIEGVEKTQPRLESNGVPRTDSLEGTPPPENQNPEHEYVTGWKLLLATGIVSLATFTMLLDTSIVVTAIPRITSDFHSLNDVGWYGSAYLLASSSLQPLTGKFYSQFNTKFTYITFLGIFELGSLICGVAQSSKMLIIGRAVAGLGGSGMMNGGLTIIAASAPPEKRPALLGFLMGFAQLGILIGPLLGGVFTQYTTWRWCFFINLPIGALIAAILLYIHIPVNKASRVVLTKTLKSVLDVFDIIGFLLFAPTMIMFLLALQWGGTSYAWNSATIIGLFCGAAGNFILFLYWEYKKGDGAMIPFGIVKQTVVWCSCLVASFFGGTMMVSSYYLAIYFQAVRGKTPTTSGINVLPGIVTSLFSAVLSGVAVGRIGYYLPFSVFSAVFQAIGSGLVATFTPTTTTAKWAGYQILLGTGRGAGMQMPVVAITSVLSQAEFPVGMALVIFAQQFGGSLWLAVASTTFSSSLSSALVKYAPGVDPRVIAEAGATGYEKVVPASALQGVVNSYNEAVNYVFYLVAGLSVAYFVFSWGMGWKSVKKVKKVEPAV